jgi:hypothetical protein
MDKIKNFIKKLTNAQFIMVIFLIIIIFGGMFIFINPAKRLIEMRNSDRRSNAQNILNAVYQYTADNNDTLPASITEVPKMICAPKASSCDGLVDLSEIVVQKKYISAIPVDPLEKDPSSSGYEIYRSASGRLNVIAAKAENNASISLSK